LIPSDAGAIAEAMRRVLADPALSADLTRRGPRAREGVLMGAIGRAHSRGLRRARQEPCQCLMPSIARPWDGMRVVLVHDWLTGMRGGEKVLESICRLFPQADLCTLVHVKGAVSPLIEARRIRTSLVQRLPSPARRYRHYLPLFPAAIEWFDLDDADLVISTSHCAAKSVVVTGRARHVCYCHSPMRYAWDQFDAYFGVDRLGRAGNAAARRRDGPDRAVGPQHRPPGAPVRGQLSVRCRPDRAVL
jgi:hypothetical protein